MIMTSSVTETDRRMRNKQQVPNITLAKDRSRQHNRNGKNRIQEPRRSETMLTINDGVEKFLN